VLSRSQDAILYFRRPILIWLQCSLDTALYHGAHSFGLVIRVIYGKCVRVLENMPSNLSTVIVLAQLCYAFRRWNEIGLFSPLAHGFVTEVFLCVQTTDLAKIFIKMRLWKTSTSYKFFLRVRENLTTLWALGEEIFRQAMCSVP